ncbi:MAG TPA: hypothetical protein VGE40_03345 [Bacilli bacterium]
MKTQVIVLGSSRYHFVNESAGTGELIEGCKVHYVEKDFVNEDNSIGMIPQTAIMEYDFFETLKTIPGVYNAELTVSLRGKKPTLKIIDFEFVSAMNFFPLIQPNKSPVNL